MPSFPSHLASYIFLPTNASHHLARRTSLKLGPHIICNQHGTGST